MDKQEILESMARTAFVLAWASYEEEEGRTYPGTDLCDVAPTETPVQFAEWAEESLQDALQRACQATLDAWGEADEEDLGRALALSIGGWTAGLDELGLPGERELPINDCDVRLFWEGGEA